MSTITKSQEDHCKLAQLHLFLSHHATMESALKKILPQIKNVNLKVLSDKSKEHCPHDSRMAGSTPLHIACYNRHIETLGSLLERGADFTAKNIEGCTALYYAFCGTFITREGETNWLIDDLEKTLVKSVLMAHVKSDISDNPYSNDGLSHFHIACASNHVEAVQLFLNNGTCVNESVNMNSTVFPGYTPLHFAVTFCGIEVTKLLLEQGADVEVKDAKGLTPLHVVFCQNLKLMTLREKERLFVSVKLSERTKLSEKLIKLFLKSNRIPDIGSTGLGKIHAACLLTDSSLAESLLQVKSTVNADSSMCPGYTPLHFAVLFSNIKTVKLLLEKGANIEAADAEGVTPFDLCRAQYGIQDLHDILSVIPDFKYVLFSDNKTKLLDFICATKSLATLEKFFQVTPKNIFLPRNCPLWPGYYLTHLAVTFFMSNCDNEEESVVNNICNVKACLSLKNNAVIQDSHGRTPIHLAFYEQNDKIVDLFFEHQSTITDVVDNHGLSLLHIACSRTNERVVTMLLLTAMDVNGIYKGKTLTPQLSSGSRPLHFAVVAGNVEIIIMLLQRGADVNATNATGLTPIHRILRGCPIKSRKEIGDLLFSSCHLENVVATKGRSTHLHVASTLGNAVAVAGLLKLGADPNDYTCNAKFSVENARSAPQKKFSQLLKCTPLHCAIINNHPKIVELLLQGGADLLHKKSDGMTLFYEILNKCGAGLTSKFSGICIRRYFTSMLANDVILQTRMKEDTGITLLHIACALYVRH